MAHKNIAAKTNKVHEVAGSIKAVMIPEFKASIQYQNKKTILDTSFDTTAKTNSPRHKNIGFFIFFLLTTCTHTITFIITLISVQPWDWKSDFPQLRYLRYYEIQILLYTLYRKSIDTSDIFDNSFESFRSYHAIHYSYNSEHFKGFSSMLALKSGLKVLFVTLEAAAGNTHQQLFVFDL